jgi:hypothetical protein
MYLLLSAPALMMADIAYRGCDGFAGHWFNADGVVHNISCALLRWQRTTPRIIVFIVKILGSLIQYNL